MKKLKDIMENLGELILVATLSAGSIFGAEKSGLTNIIVQHNDLLCYAYHEAHKKAPWLFWSDYGDPKKDPKARLMNYRIGTDIEIGLTGTFLGLAAIAAADEIRKRREEKYKPHNWRIK